MPHDASWNRQTAQAPINTPDRLPPERCTSDRKFRLMLRQILRSSENESFGRQYSIRGTGNREQGTGIERGCHPERQRRISSHAAESSRVSFPHPRTRSFAPLRMTPVLIRHCALSSLAYPSSLIPHPSSLIPHPSSLIPHPSSLLPAPSSQSPAPSSHLQA